MNRRKFTLNLLSTCMLATFAPARLGYAAPLLADARPFSVDLLRKRARQLSLHPYQASRDSLPAVLNELTYDQYRDIRFRPAEALWAEREFSAQFFHPGFYYKTPVRVFQVANDAARELRFNPALFDYGANAFNAARLEDNLGFAGFRIHHRLNYPEVVDELIAFLGASYFRALGRHMHYGLSARGLAIGTASDVGEEFPVFSEFYLEQPVDANSLVIHALLNSPSLTGAYTFTIRPGDDTIIDVVISLYTRRKVAQIGIAPLTSMFFFGANDRSGVDDFRPEVHDSDGLLIWNGSGEWLWRALVNPERLRVSTFTDRNPKGFGLLQRNRDFNSYQDLESRYENRPSAWIEPVGDWGAGGIMLIEIPTNQETNDNIVIFWRPENPLLAHTEWQGAYRLHWCRDVSFVTQRLGATLATRVGQGSAEGTRKFVLDFAGGSLPIVANSPITAQLWTSRGEFQNVVTHFNEVAASWRVTFDLRPAGTGPIELRCYLTNGTQVLSETWSYQWTG